MFDVGVIALKDVSIPYKSGLLFTQIYLPTLPGCSVGVSIPYKSGFLFTPITRLLMCLRLCRFQSPISRVSFLHWRSNMSCQTCIHRKVCVSIPYKSGLLFTPFGVFVLLTYIYRVFQSPISRVSFLHLDARLVPRDQR